MGLSRELATANIAHFYSTYLPTYGDYMVRGALEYFDSLAAEDGGGLGVEGAYNRIMNEALYRIGLYEEGFSGYPVKVGTGMENTYADSLPAHLVVDYFYPHAAGTDRAALIEQMDSGAVSNANFVLAWSHIAPVIGTPAAAQVIDAIVTHTDSMPLLPAANLAFAGLDDGQVEFLVGMYVSAFGRAPEHDGLAFWAGEVARITAQEGDAFREIGMRFYDAGQSHGEAGTALNNAGYISLAYLNVYGREAEAQGYDYWLQSLDDGLSRGAFIAEFSGAAQGDDRQYLDARIAVAGHVAQDHVSGDGALTLDFLMDVLQGVTNAGQAYAAIQDIIDIYGTPQAIGLMGMADDVGELTLA